MTHSYVDITGECGDLQMPTFFVIHSLCECLTFESFESWWLIVSDLSSDIILPKIPNAEHFLVSMIDIL